MILIDKTKKKIGIATAMSGAFKKRSDINKHTPAKFEIANPIFKNVFAPKFYLLSAQLIDFQ